MKQTTKLNYEKRWFIREKINPYKYKNAQAFNEAHKAAITDSTLAAYRRIWKALRLKDVEKAKPVEKMPKEKAAVKKVKKGPKMVTTVVRSTAVKPAVAKMEEAKPEAKVTAVSKPVTVMKERVLEKNLFFLDKFLIKTRKGKKMMMEIIKIIEPNPEFNEILVSFYFNFHAPLSEVHIKETVPKNLKIIKKIPETMQETIEAKDGMKFQSWKIIPELRKSTFTFGYICKALTDILALIFQLKKLLPRTIIRTGDINEFEYEIAHLCDGKRTMEEIAEKVGRKTSDVLGACVKLRNLGLIREELKGDFPFEVKIPGAKISITSEKILDPQIINIFLPELHLDIQTFKNIEQ